MKDLLAAIRTFLPGRRRVYLDYAAATPLSPAVVRAMRPYWREEYANPSSVHAEGQAARAAVDEARRTVAELLVTRPHDVVFTSGGTESNNLALFGLVEALGAEGRDPGEMEIISTGIEHPSVSRVLERLSLAGVAVHVVRVGQDGLIDLEHLAELLSPKTVLVTFAYANSEIGVVQDVKAVARIVRAWRRDRGTALPYIHLDASQAPLYLPCRMDSLGADLMTLDAGKCGGPKGVGVLARRGKVPLAPLLRGGDQEEGLRPGTENVPLIVGCATALTLAQEGYVARAEKVAALRDYFFFRVEELFPTAVANGSREARIANNVNISFPGISGEYAVVWLDTQGVAAATRSACSGREGGGSSVVRELGGSDEQAFGTVRFTLGEQTTVKDIDRALAVLGDFLERMSEQESGVSTSVAAIDS